MEDYLEKLKSTIINYSEKLKSFSEDEIVFKAESKRWSRKEILGHLIDSASNNHQRFVRAQLTSGLFFPGYEQDEWVIVQNYEKADWNGMVELWKNFNLHIVHLINEIPDEILKRERTVHNLDQIAWEGIPNTEAATLEYFIRDYFGHMEHHLNQIFDYAN